MDRPDVLVKDLGTLWVVSPQTNQARDWINANIAVDRSLDWNWNGGEFAVDKSGSGDVFDKIFASDLTIGGSHD